MAFYFHLAEAAGICHSTADMRGEDHASEDVQ